MKDVKLGELKREHKEAIVYYEYNEVIDVLDDMVGATVINTGFAEEYREGGMGFEYEKDGVKKRVVFGYNELGEWIVEDKEI